MTEKRFRKGYVLGDTGLIDELGEPKWFIENINSVSDLEKNWDKVIDKLNDLAEENQQFKKAAIDLIKHYLKISDEQEGVLLGNAPDERAKAILELLVNLGLQEFLKENGMEVSYE